MATSGDTKVERKSCREWSEDDFEEYLLSRMDAELVVQLETHPMRCFAFASEQPLPPRTRCFALVRHDMGWLAEMLEGAHRFRREPIWNAGIDQCGAFSIML